MSSVHDVRYEQLRGMLKKARQAAGLTQTDLAGLLGLGQSFVSKIERGEAQLDVLLFVDWCKHCGLVADQLLAEFLGWDSQRIR